MTRRALALASLLALGGSAKPAVEALPSAASLAEDIELATARVVLGTTVPGGYLKGKLVIRAKDRPAVLTQVEPACGCTIAADALPVQLAPGQVHESSIAMDLSRLPSLGLSKDGGRSTVERQVVVASQRGAKLTALVAVEVSDRVRVEPPQVRFATVAPSMRSSAAFVVTSPPEAAKPRLLAVEDLPDGVTARTEAEGDGATRVTLSWTPSAAGEMDALVTLRLDDPKDPLIRVRAQGKSEALVTVTPDRIENLAASTTRPVTVAITLHRTDGQPLAVLGARCTSHRVEVEIEGGDGPVRVIRVLIPVLPLPGEIVGSLHVRTDAPGAEALEVPIRVRAAR